MSSQDGNYKMLLCSTALLQQCLIRHSSSKRFIAVEADNKVTQGEPSRYVNGARAFKAT